jgi:hypothetical protein
MNYDPKIAASVTATAQKILIPIIRKVMPNLITQQITGVQPMSSPSGHRHRMDLYFPKTYNKKYWPYQYDVVREDRWDIERWCWDNFKGRNWNSYGSKFVFKREKDAVLFALRWA